MTSAVRFDIAHIFQRIGLWLLSLLFGVAFFCILAVPFWYIYAYVSGYHRVINSLSLSGIADSFVLFFITTFAFALPTACLYLPLVIALKDAENGRMKILLSAGAALGPCVILLTYLAGRQPPDDNLALGALCALAVGTFSTLLYLFFLKTLSRRRTRSLRSGVAPIPSN